MQRLADALPVEQAASRWIVSTDPDEHVEKIKTYLDLGFRHLVFHAPGPRPGSGSSSCTASRCCPGCGRWASDRDDEPAAGFRPKSRS